MEDTLKADREEIFSYMMGIKSGDCQREFCTFSLTSDLLTFYFHFLTLFFNFPFQYPAKDQPGSNICIALYDALSNFYATVSQH